MARWKEAVCEHCGKYFAHYQSRGQSFCSLRCSSLNHYQHHPRKQLSAAEVFETRVAHRLVEDDGGCLLWTGARNSQGYGQTTVAGKRAYVHRLSWEYHSGQPLSEGQFVLHHCDTRLCSRFDHLFIGTQLDNMRDASEKGRVAVGERSGSSRLSETQVRDILFRHAGGESQTDLGRKYGVSRQTIAHIVHGRTWRHLNRAA